MAESSQCAQCGAVVPSDAPQGLCPNCVLAAGFPTDGGSLGGLESDCGTTLGAEFVPPTPAELAPHFPDLEIIELLGRGGMGVVYKARQKRLDRLVALKILAPRIAQDPAFAERFTREARALAMLSHPQIVAVHDFGQTSFTLKLSDDADDTGTSPDGGGEYPLYYFVMEYVDGVNLRRLLETENISPQQALEIVPQICTALQFAHDHGVVHRDIKPENILLDKQGRVKIADFGIAKLVGREAKGAGDCPHLCEAPEGPSRQMGSVPLPDPPSSDQPFSDLTAAGQVIGTPQYMAPEQIEHPQDVDHRADIYSLGVVFYQMLTGELPTGLFAPPSKKVHIDVRLDEVVLRAMEKEPERRYQQVSEVKTQVENIATSPHESTDAAAQTSESGNLPKVSMCYLSTPEHLRSFRGCYINIYKGKGELRLDSAALSFCSDWPTVTIPLSSISKIARGDYPYSAKPVPIHYIEVTFVEHGVQRTLLFTPVQKELMLPHEANKVAADWLSALQEAVRASTGRMLSVGNSQVARDKFWLIKSVFLMGVFSSIGFSTIPLVLHNRLPNCLIDFLPAFITTLVTMAILLAWRRWHSRVAIDSGNQDSLGADAAGTYDKPDALDSAKRWRVIVSTSNGKPIINWVGVVLAILLETGVLLASIIFLLQFPFDELTIDSTPFFMAGAVAAAFLVLLLGSCGLAKVLQKWLMTLYSSEPQEPDTPTSGTGKAGGMPGDFSAPKRPWWSLNSREVIAHMTVAERSKFRKYGVWLGIGIAVTFFSPMAILSFTSIPVPVYCSIATAVFLIGLALWPQWWKQRASYLYSTNWARDRNVDPDSLSMMQNFQTALTLFGAAVFLIMGLLWWSPDQQAVEPLSFPEGVWSRYLTENSINKQPGDISLRVTEVSQYKQIVLVKIDCERISDSEEIYAALSGPVGVIPDNMAAGMPTVDCLLVAEKDNLGKVLVGKNALKGKPVLNIGYVLPDEQAAARAVEVVRKFHLDRSRGLTKKDCVLPLFAILRNLGKDANGKQVVEVINGSILCRFKPVARKHVAAQPQPSGEKSGREDVSQSSESAEPPNLRFLAWQDEQKEWQKGRVWHADGTPVTDKRELQLLTNGSVTQSSCSVSQNATLAKKNPRFLNLWFSHPGIDGQIYTQLTLFDEAGKQLLLGAPAGLPHCACPTGPNTKNDNLGWITFTQSPGRMGKMPKTATVRLQYSAGPWTKGSRIKPDYNGVMSLPGNATLAGIGQNAVGKAFVSIAKDIARDPPTQVSFTATTKNGRVLNDSRTTFGGPTAGPVQMRQFEFDVPLDQIAEFRCRTRRIRSIEYKNVSLQVGHDTNVQIAVPNIPIQGKQKAPQRQSSELKKVDFVIGPQKFTKGDSIVIEEVRSELGTLAKGDTVTVKGTYTLASQSKARLGFYVTQGSKEPSDNSPAVDNPIMTIQASNGSFELKHRITCNGHLHISFYPAPFGDSFGYIYFGTKSQMKKIAHRNIDKSNTSSTRTLAEEAGRQSSEKPTEDMQTYLQKTKELVSQHKDKEALERFIWFHEHALEYEPSMSAVRLSFALSAWKKLADVYPPAMEALVDIRDWNTMQLKQGQGNADLFHDVAAINSTLGENAKTLRLFRKLDKSNATFAGKCWHYAKDVVYVAKEYNLAGRYVKHPLKDFELEKTAYISKIGMYSDPRFEKPEFKQWNESSFVKGCLRLIELATFNGDKKTAEEIRKRAESVVGHPVDVPKPSAKSAKAIGGDGSGKK